MLKVLKGSKFVKVSASDSPIVKLFRSKTDKRFVLDVVAPGFAAADVVAELSPNQDEIRLTLNPTGRPPFEEDRAIKLMIAHAREEVVPPSRHRAEVPGDLEKIVLRCLAKSPGDRYQTAAALARALSECEAAPRWSREQAARWWREDETARERVQGEPVS